MLTILFDTHDQLRNGSSTHDLISDFNVTAKKRGRRVVTFMMTSIIIVFNLLGLSDILGRPLDNDLGMVSLVCIITFD